MRIRVLQYWMGFLGPSHSPTSNRLYARHIWREGGEMEKQVKRQMSRSQWLLKYSRAICFFVLVGFLVLNLESGTEADTRTVKFKNNTGQKADDLHIIFKNATTVDIDRTRPFESEIVSGDSRTHNLWGGDVPACSSATVRFSTGWGIRATIEKWWWTSGGNATKEGDRVGDEREDSGGRELSVSGDAAAGDGLISVSVGGITGEFQTKAGYYPSETLDAFMSFLEELGSPEELVYSVLESPTSISFWGNVLGDDDDLLQAELIQDDSGQHLLLSQQYVGQPGDVNGDESINILDCLAVANHILGFSELTGDAFWRGDCTGDEVINILDVLAIANVILGIIPECPGGGACKPVVTPEVIEFLKALRSYLPPEDCARLMALAKEVQVPTEYSLSQNYPNPFNPSTDIRYQIADGRLPIHTSMKVYNILGQEVRTLVNEVQEPGHYTVTWDGKDNSDNYVASGVYFYRLTMADFTATKSMVLMK